MKSEKDITTTGQLRTLLANAVKGVLNGDLAIDKAMALHKLSKNISESLYSETKIAMFRKEAGLGSETFGSLQLGDRESEYANSKG
jgi:hypothetical protein